MAVGWVLFFILFAGWGDAASINNDESNSSYDTIVIGMGASGTAAASTLARAGKKILALEAQGRVGGRVHTVPCGDDGVIELGAEWIHGTEHSPTYKAAIDNNVTILPQDLGETMVWSNGQLGDTRLMQQLLNYTLESADDPPETPEPLGRHITKKLLTYISEHHPHLANDTDFITEFLALSDLIVDSYEGSDSWDDVTTDSRFEELGGSQVMSWNTHGYRTLFKILLNTYKDGTGLPKLTVKLNTEVTQISWSQEPGKKVTIKTKDGGKFTADNVIVTASVGVLKERHNTLFSPQLPPKKITAIENISIGVINKIVLFFPSCWWPKDSFYGFIWRADDKKKVPDEDKWTTKIASVSPPMGCDDKALTFWTNGETARLIETLPEEVVTSKCMELLRKFLGNFTIPEPTGMLRSTWFSNPFTRGSYTFDNLLTPQHPLIRVELAEPVTDTSGKPVILFAGEASNPIHFSTVHGAVETGMREAARLLNTTLDIARGVASTPL